VQAAAQGHGGKLKSVFNLGSSVFRKDELATCFELFVDKENEGHITLDQLDAAMMLLGEEENDASNWILENQHQDWVQAGKVNFEGFLEFITTKCSQESEWEFRHTLTYWIAITTLIGSILFTLGSFMWLFDDSFTTNTSLALVTYPFLAGGVLFSISSYIAYYEVINDQKPDDKQIWFTCDRDIMFKAGPLGSLSFNIGTTVFGIAVFAGPFAATGSDKQHEEMLNYGPSFLGCIFFCIGSFIECKHNKVWEVATGIRTLVWWVCMNNAVGSFFFTFAAAFGIFYDKLTNTETNNLIIWPYTIGSFQFAIAACLQLFMWKRNLFGAGWMRELMEQQWKDKDDHKPLIKEETNWLMIAVLFIYSIGASLAVVEVAFQSLDGTSYAQIVTAIFGLLIMLGVISLGAVLHSKPPTQAYKYMFIGLHCIMLVFVSAKVAQVYHLSKCCTLDENICLCNGLVYNTDDHGEK